MAAGYPLTKEIADNKLGTTVKDIRDAFNRAAGTKERFDRLTDPELTALGYTAGEVTTIRSALIDLTNLGKIAHGQGTQAAANDFFFHADKLTGIS